ncbi:MAG: carbon-nitrogen hydrolase family protein [Rhodospirillaceae bacterium]|nr:carbon-nitrogen hydrolase family protein [Rhodospirillaceae bacterium]MDE0254923.1 carbon-nitrogen hydrolase family protein [Rhodospirillaceae bacterium]MDE0617629.1 carbon-nitrogen hydrolase family protein [Rhodospirillaceae bacterium]
MARVRVALVQSSPSPQADEICEEVADWIARAASRGADLVVFPELFFPGFHKLLSGWRGDRQVLPAFRDSAQPIPGPISDEACRMAKSHAVHVVFTQLEKDDESGRIYNASMLIGPDGSLLLRHRKTMLTPGLETRGLARGNGHEVVPTALGSFGLLICADATCPEPARVLALRGAEIVCVSSGDFRSPWQVDGDDLAERIWNHCSASPTRAVDNNVYWLAVNSAGKQGGIEFFGGSRIISPLGQVIAQGGWGPDARQLLVGEIDLSLRHRVESTFSLARRRRPELYSEISRTDKMAELPATKSGSLA